MSRDESDSRWDETPAVPTREATRCPVSRADGYLRTRESRDYRAELGRANTGRPANTTCPECGRPMRGKPVVGLSGRVRLPGHLLPGDEWPRRWCPGSQRLLEVGSDAGG